MGDGQIISNCFPPALLFPPLPEYSSLSGNLLLRGVVIEPQLMVVSLLLAQETPVFLKVCPFALQEAIARNSVLYYSTCTGKRQSAKYRLTPLLFSFIMAAEDEKTFSLFLVS